MVGAGEREILLEQAHDETVPKTAATSLDIAASERMYVLLTFGDNDYDRGKGLAEMHGGGGEHSLWATL